MRSRTRNCSRQQQHFAARTTLRLVVESDVRAGVVTPVSHRFAKKVRRVMTPNPKRRRRSHFRNTNKYCLLCSNWTWEEERVLDAFLQLEAGSCPRCPYLLETKDCTIEKNASCANVSSAKIALISFIVISRMRIYYPLIFSLHQMTALDHAAG